MKNTNKETAVDTAKTGNHEAPLGNEKVIEADLEQEFYKLTTERIEDVGQIPLSHAIADNHLDVNRILARAFSDKEI